jgi:SAM-dependent methyltransferase
LTIPTVRYEDLSFEYYDRVRHPTCADFRYASLRLISAYLALARLGDSPRILEVGAGRSVFVELAPEFPRLLGRTIVTDHSQGMIRHTGLIGSGISLVCADAEALPFIDSGFDLLIASLGDPYNTERFWCEASRVMAEGGRCIFTAPAASWADRYRSERQSGHKGRAVFEIEGGSTVAVPSFVMSPPEQISVIGRFGLMATDVWTFTRDMFPDGLPLSPKIAEFTRSATPVVSQFVIRK